MHPVEIVGSSRFRCRWRGWLGTAAVVAVCACTSRNLEPPTMVPEPFPHSTGPVTINRNIDLLFLVDDSSSMRLSQNNLLANFPVFMTTLESAPGGLPDVHIAVVSSDMGAGDGAIAGCDATGGKNGVFQYTNRAPAGSDCTANALNANQTFISNVAGQANYSGRLDETFTCIASLGEMGCGFEHQFAAILRALGADGRPAPAENQGFLRPDAYLVIVVITNEDDCSARAGVDLYDITSNLDMASTLGPPTNFRCNEFGHLCTSNGGAFMGPARAAPNDDVNATVTYDFCMSNDTGGYLLSVKETADRIKALKADPSQVLVAAIAGAPAPYTVHWQSPSLADSSCGAGSCPWPAISHSCTSPDGSFADPGVRVAQLVQQFGANGLALSICDQSFAPALMRLAEQLNSHVSMPCVLGQVARRPGTTSDDCTVTTSTVDGAGQTSQSPVAACAETGGVGPCWRLIPGAAGCGGQSVEVVSDPSAPASAGPSASAECSLCVAGVPDAARGCP